MRAYEACLAGKKGPASNTDKYAPALEPDLKLFE